MTCAACVYSSNCALNTCLFDNIYIKRLPFGEFGFSCRYLFDHRLSIYVNINITI